jgi:hypothetical protein
VPTHHAESNIKIERYQAVVVISSKQSISVDITKDVSTCLKWFAKECQV